MLSGKLVQLFTNLETQTTLIKRKVIINDNLAFDFSVCKSYSYRLLYTQFLHL